MKQRKGFTLLELIVVIIIIGILSTLGLTQYAGFIEKSRGAEARAILGDMRTFAAVYFMKTGSTFNITDADLSLGALDGQIPTTGGCVATHYFTYAFADPAAAATNIAMTATRCIANGKQPDGPAATTLILTSDFASVADPADAWSGTGGY